MDERSRAVIVGLRGPDDRPLYRSYGTLVGGDERAGRGLEGARPLAASRYGSGTQRRTFRSSISPSPLPCQALVKSVTARALPAAASGSSSVA